MKYKYPVILEKIDNEFVIQFPDVPEALTSGDNKLEALEEARDALEEALAARMKNNEDIPVPSSLDKYQHSVLVSFSIALKVALYIYLRENHINQSQLANILGINEKEVRRLLDPKHNSTIKSLGKAYQTLDFNYQIEIPAKKNFTENI